MLKLNVVMKAMLGMIRERALFDRILAFHGIQVDGIEMQTPGKTIEYHYRCGRPDEWRDIFTEQEKARSLAIIGRDVLDHFSRVSAPNLTSATALKQMPRMDLAAIKSRHRSRLSARRPHGLY